ncbi:MAG: hypothetical protein WCK74_11065 [Gemmatimonadaceae bacterium]|jgi:hypothetical protein
MLRFPAALAVAGLWALASTARAQQPKPVLTFGDSGTTVVVGGKVRTTMLLSSKRHFPSGTAFLLLPKDATGQESSIDLNARSSSLFLAVDGPKVGSFTMSGMMFFYLTASVTSETYGILPTLLYADLKNERWRFAVGQQMDVFSERTPNMVDSYFTLAASGNAGNSSRAQLRAERFFPVGPQGRLSLTLAASEPITSYFSSDLRNNSADNGRPNAEWAVKYRSGTDTAAWVPFDRLELALSGVHGSYRVFKNDAMGTNIRVNHPQVAGLAGEFAFRLGNRVGVQGEVYRGKALGNYAASIFQTTKGAFDTEVHSRGVWSELAFYAKRNLQSRIGYGQDRCDEADLKGAGVLQNSTVFGNVIWDINRIMQVGAEVSYKHTQYLAPLRNNQGMTAMFMTQFKF